MVYYQIENFSDGLASVQNNKGWGYISQEGIEIISPKYNEAGQFVNGLAWVLLEGKNYLIDKTGKINSIE